MLTLGPSTAGPSITTTSPSHLRKRRLQKASKQAAQSHRGNRQPSQVKKKPGPSEASGPAECHSPRLWRPQVHKTPPPPPRSRPQASAQEANRSPAIGLPPLASTPWAGTPTSLIPGGIPEHLGFREREVVLCRMGRGFPNSTAYTPLVFIGQISMKRPRVALPWPGSTGTPRAAERSQKLRPCWVASVCLPQPGMALLSRRCQSQAPPQPRPQQVRLQQEVRPQKTHGPIPGTQGFKGKG